MPLAPGLYPSSARPAASFPDSRYGAAPSRVNHDEAAASAADREQYLPWTSRKARRRIDQSENIASRRCASNYGDRQRPWHGACTLVRDPTAPTPTGRCGSPYRLAQHAQTAGAYVQREESVSHPQQARLGYGGVHCHSGGSAGSQMNFA